MDEHKNSTFTWTSSGWKDVCSRYETDTVEITLRVDTDATVLLDVSIVLKEVPKMVGLGFHQHLGENTMLTDTFAPFINQRKM